MLPFQNQQNTSQNPFMAYQRFYLNMFAAVKGEGEKEYQKGVNDTMFFKLAISVDNEMSKNAEIKAKVGSKQSYNLAPINSVKGYLKSVSTYKEEIDGKPTHKIKITLFDPAAPYYNPFQDIDATNKLNGTTTGAIYEVTTSYSLKGKELISKLSNIDFSDSGQMIEIIILPAKNKDDGYKTQIISKGRKVFNVMIKQGDTVIKDRFGDPARGSHIVHDEYNEEYMRNLAENTDDNEALRVSMDSLYRKFIKTELTPKSHDMFLGTLRSVLECDLVENGVDNEGKPKFKYLSLKNEEVTEDNFVTIDDDVEEGKSFKESLDETLVGVTNDAQSFPESDDDLPF